MVYNFIRGYSFRGSQNPKILIDGRQLQVSAPGPSTGETEHVILTGTHADRCKIHTYTAAHTDELSMKYPHRNVLSQQSPPDLRSADQD